MTFLDPRKEGATHYKFQAATPTLEQMFVKLVNAGRKLGHQLRMRQQSEPSVIFDRIISAWIASPALVAPAANLPPPSPSILVSGSTEAVTVILHSPVTTPLHHLKPTAANIYLLKILVRAGKPSSNFIWGVSYLRRSVGVVGSVTNPSLSLIVC